MTSVEEADQADMERRCAAHERWMRSSPDARALADQYVDVLTRRVNRGYERHGWDPTDMLDQHW